MMRPNDKTEVLHRKGQFQSGGTKIRTETFAPAGAESLPSVIFLHGANGLPATSFFLPILAQSFAAASLTVHLVHYFDRTATRYADRSTIRRFSNDWLETVSDVVSFVDQMNPLSGIGLFGFSLGGYLAAAEAARNPRIGAAVILSGGIDEASAQSIHCCAPTLILHGENDLRVPLSEARRLEMAFKKAGCVLEVQTYPGEPHIMSLGTYADVMERSIRFFHTRLNKPPYQKGHDGG